MSLLANAPGDYLRDWTSQTVARARALAAEPAKAIILGLTLVALGMLIAYPMLLLIKFSVFDNTGKPGLQPLIHAFNEPGILKAVINTAWLGFYTTFGSLVLGVPLAWLVARTDIPWKGFVRFSVAIAFVIPSFITVISWLALASPNSGYLNNFLRFVFGPDVPVFNIVSFGGLVFIEITHLYPLVFFATYAALSNIDPSNEQAARIAGAGRFRTAFSVTVPLVRPAIVASVVLVLLDALSSFGAPAIIGTMANFSVLTTKIYLLLSFPPRLELAAAISLPIVLCTLVCLILQRILVGSNRFRTITGKGGSAAPVRLGGSLWPIAFVTGVVLIATSLLPLAALLLLSLQKFFGADITVANLSLKNFALLSKPSLQVLDAINHSLFLSTGTAILCTVLGVLAAWFVERTNNFGRGIVTFLILLTYGFPTVTFAVALMLGYLDLFYGTFTILIMAYVAKNLPIAFVMFRSALKQIAPELEEVARVVGASWSRTLIEVTGPLLKSSAWAAALLIFALTLRELSMSAILTQPDTQVMSTRVMEFLETGAVELAAAMAVTIVVFSVVALLVLRLLSGKSIAEVR
jgi:iron(III) transport system permease protein